MDSLTLAVVIGIVVVAAAVFVIVLRALVVAPRTEEGTVVPGFSERTLRVIRSTR